MLFFHWLLLFFNYWGYFLNTLGLRFIILQNYLLYHACWLNLRFKSRFLLLCYALCSSFPKIFLFFFPLISLFNRRNFRKLSSSRWLNKFTTEEWLNFGFCLFCLAFNLGCWMFNKSLQGTKNTFSFLGLGVRLRAVWAVFSVMAWNF